MADQAEGLAQPAPWESAGGAGLRSLGEAATPATQAAPNEANSVPPAEAAAEELPPARQEWASVGMEPLAKLGRMGMHPVIALDILGDQAVMDLMRYLRRLCEQQQRVQIAQHGAVALLRGGPRAAQVPALSALAQRIVDQFPAHDASNEEVRRDLAKKSPIDERIDRVLAKLREPDEREQSEPAPVGQYEEVQPDDGEYAPPPAGNTTCRTY